MESSLLLTKFYAYVLTEKRVSANSYSAYKSDIKQFELFLQQHKLTILTAVPETIKDFLHDLHSNNISARSMARKISSIKSLYIFLHERHGIKNPTELITAPKIGTALPKFLTEQEIAELFAVTEQDTSLLGKRNKFMLYLLYATGMRITELTTLHTGTIQFDTGFITISGKGGKVRMVPLPHSILDMAREYITHVHPKLLDGARSEYLFPIMYGGKLKAITRQAFWLILNDFWRKTSIKHTISPHQLRHSLATHLLKNGADLLSLQMILGHENVTTVQIYTHVEVSHLRTVYDKKHPRS